MTHDDTANPSGATGGPDASDVIEGPIGGSHSKEPTSSGPIGADLDELPVIDLDQGDPADQGRSIEGGTLLPERGLVGAD